MRDFTKYSLVNDELVLLKIASSHCIWVGKKIKILFYLYNCT